MFIYASILTWSIVEILNILTNKFIIYDIVKLLEFSPMVYGLNNVLTPKPKRISTILLYCILNIIFYLYELIKLDLTLVNEQKKILLFSIY